MCHCVLVVNHVLYYGTLVKDNGSTHYRGEFKGRAQGGRALPNPPPDPQIPLLAAKIRNTLIEQSPTLIKQSLTNTRFVIMPMLNFQ